MTDATLDLSREGVHRDPTAHDPLSSGTFTQRLAGLVSRAISRKSSRRSFLTKTAVVGSALSVAPLDFIFKPGSAYAYTCGTCGDGWTAFCCTINGGRNSCPSGSFVAGWWKADNAAYCCGAARYIIDCNASCPTSCSCHCAGGSCDGRRTCCNQFRYGQCHQEISCYGPVVCRIATCTPPWRYDASCTTASATDNRTVNHGAPCIPSCNPTPPPTAISTKYKALGGAGGILGPVVQSERAVAGGGGRWAKYRNGNIYWSSATGAHEVHGAILTEFDRVGGVHASFRYPTTDMTTSSNGRAKYNTFQGGRIYYLYIDGARRTPSLPGAFLLKHEQLGGIYGVLGLPRTSPVRSSDGRSLYINFEHGRIYERSSVGVVEIHGAVFAKHEAIGGVHGALGYPTADLLTYSGGKAQLFEHGFITYSGGVARESHGPIAARYRTNGYVNGTLGWPTSDVTAVGDGHGDYQVFAGGRIYWATSTGAHDVHGAVLDAWLGTYGGPTGSIGYPTGEIFTDGSLRRQQFQRGRLTYDPATRLVTLG